MKKMPIKLARQITDQYKFCSNLSEVNEKMICSLVYRTSYLGSTWGHALSLNWIALLEMTENRCLNLDVQK